MRDCRSKNSINTTNMQSGTTGKGKFLSVTDKNIDDPLVRNLLLIQVLPFSLPGNHGK